MSLETQIMAEMKDAMKAKDEATLRSLRAIKAEIIKAKTEPGAGGEIDDGDFGFARSRGLCGCPADVSDRCASLE